MKTYFKLLKVKDEHPITKASDPGFFFLMHRAALLGLKDSDLLTESQFRRAEESLLQKQRENAAYPND